MPKFKKLVKTPLGFTLIELLLVIAIIGIVIAIGAASYSASQRNGRNAKRQSDLAKIASALEQYYQDHNQYPKTPDSGTTNYVAENAGNDCSSQAICCLLGGTTASGLPASANCQPVGSTYKTYLTSLPFDPLSSQMSTTSSYVYYAGGYSNFAGVLTPTAQFFVLATKQYEGASTTSLGSNLLTAGNIGNPNTLAPDGSVLTTANVFSALAPTGNQYFVRSPKL